MSNLIAACVGDMHVCPIKGHGSSPILPNGSSILVEGKPIARVGDVTGCGAVITQGYPLALADGMPVAYLGSPTSHGGSIVSGNPRVILGIATNTAPVVDFALAGALDDKGQLTPAAKQLLEKDPQEFVRQAVKKGALIDDGIAEESLDDSPAEEARPQVRVEVGIFFDGTGNNRDNTQAYQQQLDECLTANAAGAMSEESCSSELSQIMEGSFLNAETNVSKLERMYQQGRFQSDERKQVHRIATYVSGVGTKSGEPDDGRSMGLGLGEQGILKKIDKGCGELVFEIGDSVKEPIDELVLDAVADLENLDFSAHDERTGRISVNLRPEQVQRAVHFVAQHERRHNFSLNSLRGESGNLPEHFSEWVLPGAHSSASLGYAVVTSLCAYGLTVKYGVNIHAFPCI